MTYKVKDDEIAIIIKPLLRQDGTWNNEVIHTGLYYNTGGAISPGILDDLVKCASLMVCFFDIANEKPELLMEVEERLFNKYGSKFWSEYVANKKLMIAPSSGIPNSLDDTEFMTKKNTPSAEKKTN